MRKHFFYLPVIIVLVAFVVSQEVRLQHLTEANDALRAGMVIASGGEPKLVPPLPAPRDPSAAAEESRDQESADRAASQKAKEAEVARIRESIIKERALEIRQRIEARLLAWKEILKLTEAQEVQLRAAMEEGEQKLDMLSRRKPEKGAPFRPYLEEGAALQTAQEEAIKSLLSPDQQIALERQKSSELQSQAEVQAGKALAKLQDNLTLSEAQKDAVFQMYAQQALAFDPVRIIREGGEPAAVVEQQRHAAKEQLQQILTPEQYKLYTGQEEERAVLERQRGF